MRAAVLSYHTCTHTGTEWFPHLRAMHYSCWLLMECTQNLTGLLFPRLRLLGMLSEPAGKQVWEGCKAFLQGPEHTVQPSLEKKEKKQNLFVSLEKKNDQISKLPPAHSNNAISHQHRLCTLLEIVLKKKSWKSGVDANKQTHSVKNLLSFITFSRLIHASFLLIEKSICSAE